MKNFVSHPSGLRSFGMGKQASLLEQPAEILLAGDVMRAFLAHQAGHAFVFDFETFQSDDANVFFAMFPDLALAQLH
jgi:hypothetical protein